jgi:hypothetical protein
MKTYRQWLEANREGQLAAVENIPMRLQYAGTSATESIANILKAFETLGIEVPPNTDPIHFAAMVKRVASDMNLAGRDWKQLITKGYVGE